MTREREQDVSRDDAGRDDVGGEESEADEAATRRAELVTSHADPETAALLAAAVRPDNAPSMETRADGPRVRTTIERATTGGLGATTDDYVVNLAVARRVAAAADRDEQPADHTTDVDGVDNADGDIDADSNTDADADGNTDTDRDT